MAYKIYTTEAFVISSRPSRDADSSLLMFTEQFGLLQAVATSVRQVRSKLRFSLQPLSYSNVSLVKGKEVWRVTSARKHISLYDKRLPIEVRTMFARILGYVERFCGREIVESDIFDLLRMVSKFVFISEYKQIDISLMVKGLERLFLLRVLFALGYVKEDIEVTTYISGTIDMNIVKEVADDKQVTKVIEKGINESHL